MGLIRAIANAAGGVMADQWKEYFYCDSLNEDILVIKGQKRTSSKRQSSNVKGEDNIITSGSVIAVNEGQCMIIVDQGKIAEVCAEPGEFTYDASTEPSIFNGKLGESIKDTFKNIGRRFTFGGDPPKDQRVYYVNIKEIIGNKYGTANPVPVLAVYPNLNNFEIELSIKCFGEYSYQIVDPILFYTKVCANVTDRYERSRIDSQLKTELLTALQPAFGKLSEQGIRYSSMPAHTMEMADALNEALSEKWRAQRGIEVASFGISSIKASEEDEKMLKEAQRAAINRDPAMAAATMTQATAAAMQNAASNPNGAMLGFAGLNMAQGAGGMGAASLFQVASQQQAMQQPMQQQMQPQMQQPVQQPVQQAAPAGAAASWVCPDCGAENSGKFCTNCGKPAPAPAQKATWFCPDCGAKNEGKFCTNCGHPKPQ